MRFMYSSSCIDVQFVMHSCTVRQAFMCSLSCIYMYVQFVIRSCAWHHVSVFSLLTIDAAPNGDGLTEYRLTIGRLNPVIGACACAL